MNEILKWVEPNIKLDDIFAINNQTLGAYQTTISELGKSPWINIRSFSLSPSKLISLVLDCSAFLPTISLSFDDSDNIFKSLDFPLDQDVASIYLKGKGKKHHPIRCDFWITKISGNTTILLNGILKIPNAFDDKTFGVNSSSIEAIFKASRDLGLGFASNFETSNDIQNWVSFNQNYIEFVEATKNKSYIDTNSWINTFIDCFYCMNWLNGELNYSLNEELDKGIITALNDIKNQDAIEKFDTFFQTNHPNFLSTDYGIEIEPNLNQESNLERGHNLIGVSMDMTNLEIKAENFFVGTEESELYVKIKGRDINDVLVSKQRWLGLQNSNVHANWNKAKAQNNMNQRENSGLKGVSYGLCTELMRGRRIPFYIFDFNSKEMDWAKNEISLPSKLPRQNTFWSGFYVVDSVRYEWNSFGFKTYTKLSRKQWNKKRIPHFGAVIASN